MSKAVSAKTNVPASDTPDSTVVDSKPVWALPVPPTSLAKGSWKNPDELMTPVVPDVWVGPPKA